jgi:hypothetical protein
MYFPTSAVTPVSIQAYRITHKVDIGCEMLQQICGGSLNIVDLIRKTRQLVAIASRGRQVPIDVHGLNELSQHFCLSGKQPSVEDEEEVDNRSLGEAAAEIAQAIKQERAKSKGSDTLLGKFFSGLSQLKPAIKIVIGKIQILGGLTFSCSLSFPQEVPN